MAATTTVPPSHGVRWRLRCSLGNVSAILFIERHPSPGVDDLDMGILREMSRGPVVFWGGMDPRVSTAEIADRIGVNRTTVWSRLKSWEKAGFLIRQEVIPNPRLFGAGVAYGGVRVDDPRRKAEVLHALALMDGVIGGLDAVGPWIGIEYAHESMAALKRCGRLVGALPGVDEVSTCVAFNPPPHRFEPDQRDWRILAAMRRAPRERLALIAKEAGLSPRTLTRRYRELLEGHAFWSFPVFDFTRYHGASMARFNLTLAGADEARSFESACRKRFDQLVWLSVLESVDSESNSPVVLADTYFHLAAPGEADDLHQTLLGMADVKDAHLGFPKATFIVTEWFEERIEVQLRKVGARRQAPQRLTTP